VERLIFLAPIAGLIAGMLGAGMVVVFYMLKLRRRPVAVSSTLLWSRAVKDMEGNIPFQRVSPTVLLWMHLFIVILLALAIARPVLDDAMVDGKRVYLVIDTTASMNAVVNGKSGLELSKARAIERVRVLFDSGRSPIVSVIESGLKPRVVLADSNQRGRLIGAITAIEPTDQPGKIVDAIELVQSLLDTGAGDDGEDGVKTEPAAVWVYSDGGSITAAQLALRGGSGVSVSPYDDDGELGNLGIVALGASRDRSDPAEARIFVRVVRNDNGPKAAVVRVFDGETVIESRAVSFESDVDSLSETFELRLMRAALLRIEIEVDDALDVDDRAWVSVPDPSPARIVVVAPDAAADPLLVDVLEVISRTSIAVVDEDAPLNDMDLVVFDRVSPAVLPSAATVGFASLLPSQPRSDRLDELGRRTRMISWDRADPIVRDAGLGLVAYQRSVRLPDAGVGVKVLASDRDGVVIAEEAIGSFRHLRIAFALHDSNWAVQVGLAIFLVNTIEELLPGTSGVGAVYSTGKVYAFDEGPTGSITVGPFRRAEVKEIGDQEIGVGVLDRDESMLSVRSPVVVGSSSQRNIDRYEGRSERDLWRWFTLAAIGLIAIEWFVYAWRTKVSLG
jgi:Aerotolerance regulator N-terminal